MEKFHNNVVQVPLTEENIWTLVKLFRDGELIKVAPELEAKFIAAYHESKLAEIKAAKAQRYIENTPDIEEMLAAAENFSFADTALLAAWDAYVLAISECDDVELYEPLPYERFAAVLNVFVQNYDMTPAIERIAREAETLPFEIKASNWTKEELRRAMEELQEMQANLQSAEISEKAVELKNRVQAVKTSIKAIEAVRTAFEHAIECADAPPDKIIELEANARVAWAQIRSKIQALYKEFEEDYEHLKEHNEMELPIGDTIQDGKVRGVRAVLALMDELEDCFK